MTPRGSASGDPRRGRPRPSSGRAPTASRPRSAAHERFLALERDRAVREWRRYEGTPQRELFRDLRDRFLARNARPGGWALDVGSGPGRFLPRLGGAATRRVALDLSLATLRVGRELTGAARDVSTAPAERVRGDALSPPFAPRSFGVVALIGNALGFEASAGERMLSAVEALVAPAGVLLLEIAPGPGERSNYLARLPPTAVRRLLAAPPAAVRPRIEREGFRTEPARHRSAGFRRWTVEELDRRWALRGWARTEAVAVAPALGADPERLEQVARDPRAWARLEELEELLGREPPRWNAAAAVLLAASPGPRTSEGL